MKEIVFVTHNQNKVNEVKKILEKFQIKVLSLSDLNISYKEPDETGLTYAENSEIKAKEAKKYTNLPVFSDDSGIEIEGLNNEPGIYSARFIEAHGGIESTLKYVLTNIKNNRKAHFTCNICYIDENNKLYHVEGICKGSIASKITTGSGFGYDPIFIPDGYTKTFAELGEEEKNKISHRSLALEKLGRLIHN